MMNFARLFLTAAVVMMPLPAMAEPFTYAPEKCEFSMTFPEKPYVEQKCTGGETKQCAEIVTYTKIVSPESSVNFRIICSNPPAAELARYTPEVMKETVKQLLSDATLDGAEPKASELEGYKVASTVSAGMRGEREIIYTAQIWIGKTSLLSLEGDMSGPQHAESDKLFAEILGSMHPKDRPTKPEAEASAPAAKPPAAP